MMVVNYVLLVMIAPKELQTTIFILVLKVLIVNELSTN
jgi:hypothetical protein